MSTAQNTTEVRSQIRSKYHSLKKDERNKAIEQLALFKNTDSMRELIHIFNECGWRETQFQVLKVLPYFIDQRGLEFLYQVALQEKDYPMAEAAIYALSETKNTWAALFIAEMYLNCKENLKPACALALGQISHRALLNELMTDLDSALKNQSTLLAKNIILTLGELKAHQSVPSLMQVAQNKMHRDLALSAIVSLGKITRDQKVFEQLETYFNKDSFEYQVFGSVKNQCLFRAQWKLEDYLNKMIENKIFHPALMYELNAFSADDVKESIQLVFENLDHQKKIQLYKALDFKNKEKWFPESFIKDFIQSENDEHNLDNFQKLDETAKMNKINLFCQKALVSLPNRKKIETQVKILEKFFIDHFIGANKESVEVRSRSVRALAQLKVNSKKIHQYFLSVDEKSKADLTKDVLIYAQSYRSTEHLKFILSLSEKDVVINSQSYLKALLSQDIQTEQKKVEEVIELLKANSDAEIQILILKLATQNNLLKYKNLALNQLQSKHQVVQLNALFAIKSFNDEALTDQVSQFLKSDSESLAGRCLDVLLSMTGIRAKRKAIDFYIEQALNEDIVDKVIRTFVPPDNDSDYFYLQAEKALQLVMQNNNYNEQIDIMQNFTDKLKTHSQSFLKTQVFPSDVDLIAIDQDFEKLIPAYKNYDETSKSALRSAEVPLRHPDLFDRFVDKSSIILGYTKAIDLILEKQLGRKILFPKIETKMNEFQNLIHSLSLHEDYPQFDKVMQMTQLQKHFNQQSLPLHKMGLVAKGFMNGKIVNEHFKILDGLRAWAVVLLLFASKNKLTNKALILNEVSESDVVELAKKLIWLQDIRNPIAHRQTLVDFKAIEQVKVETIKTLQLMSKVLTI